MYPEKCAPEKTLILFNLANEPSLNARSMWSDITPTSIVNAKGPVAPWRNRRLTWSTKPIDMLCLGLWKCERIEEAL